MKWDFSSVVVWGLDEDGLDGFNRFELAVVELAKRIGGELEQGALINGYQKAYHITRNGEVICNCLTGGCGSAAGSSQFQAASTADEVYPILQEMFPLHSVSRLDACEDYSGEGVFEKLEAMLTKICGDHGVSMSPFGEGHFRPDGTRDATKGRTWYCGSKSSPFRVVLYEKGLQRIAAGIPDDPTRTRLEVRIRPSSKAKAKIGAMNLQPEDLFGMSRWGMVVGEALGRSDVERIAIGSVWKPSEIENMALKIVRMFDRGLDSLLEQVGTPEAVGALLFDVQKRVKEAKSVETRRKLVSV